MNETGITFENVRRNFRRADGREVVAVSDVSVEIKAGEFVCLVGPSGCGKTTLLQLVSGLLSPTAGAITVGGAPISGPGPDRGFVFQKDSVFPWMRVIDNVEYGLKRRGMPHDERRERALRYLDLVGLSDVAKAWPKELSGGMLKRVAIATVFANDSGVLLLDEPFGALDYVTKRQLHDVLLDLWVDAGRERRRTILFVTHDVDEALLLSDRILVVKQGAMADDIALKAERPRGVDSLASAELLAIKHRLLAHLGLEPATGSEA
ncbi:ABC transporter ATP-binding protein [Pikeienuella piscinae]|uniref:ABC transporter ATP-binding protein n=1 Tax=Pikeienuella piscinae TaxID=2748098 RepID=A0A7L5BXV4_9RHOB|nr:ABC transporter ATP-binding protein [Pikeienuella piscinae]QIE56755.1 ABC transporter ATP-binding protein [Pikeienuella piscinae]